MRGCDGGTQRPAGVDDPGRRLATSIEEISSPGGLVRFRAHWTQLCLSLTTPAPSTPHLVQEIGAISDSASPVGDGQPDHRSPGRTRSHIPTVLLSENDILLSENMVIHDSSAL